MMVTKNITGILAVILVYFCNGDVLATYTF